MYRFEIGFDHPLYLWLLLLVLPPLWFFSFRSLAGLGRIRRLLAIAFRSLVVTLIVCALAEIQWLRTSEKVTVIYLLDQSESIPSAKRQVMLDYVIAEVKQHRDAAREDRAGVIVFGHEAAIEIPPFDDDLPNIGRIETFLRRTDATNLEAALKLAQASFPEDSAKRIVLVTDGNENLGSARAIAPLIVDQGIGIDVVPVRLATRSEIAVEKITLPADLRRGEPTEARVVLQHYAETPGAAAAPVTGRLRVLRNDGQQEELIGDEQQVTLPPGKSVINLRHTIDKPAMYTYRAVFTPDQPADDLMPQNNEATTFTHVRGKGRVLLIEDRDHPGEFDFLIERLRRLNLELDVQSTDQLFGSLAELQAYDAVVLANVPRSSGDEVNTVSSFSDEQIEMLVRNTEQLGCGLVMLGGPNSFGAGGWANTELEKAMPVDFQIKNQKIEAVGALVLMMHASEMAQGNHWQKVVAREAVKSLGEMDYCGLIHWDDFSGDAWLWGGNQGLIRVSSQRKMMLAQLNRMQPGDMPQFEPSMGIALAAFNRVKASVKHMIIISDGDPAPPSAQMLQMFQQAGIKISTVAIGTHGPAGSTPLQNIATATQGQYYVVTNPKALPKIYQREARRVAQPLVKDLDNVPPRLVYPHPMLAGIDEPFPPLKGMVLTTVKENPLVEVALRSPIPDEPDNSTVLASWTYGLGRTVVLTTDAGHRWADAWTQWAGYDKLFSQIVRWAMRPVNDEEKYTVAADVRDDKVRVVITALDKDDQLLNFLQISGAAVGPDLAPFGFDVRQEAPGRYVGEFPVTKSGSYHLTLSPGPGKPPILAGVNVPYSAEYRDRATNDVLLQSLVALRPKGGEPGRLIGSDLIGEQLPALLEVDTFRHNLSKATSSRDVWPLMLLVAAGLFFADVFVRRVTIGTEWLVAGWAWLRARLFRTGPETPLAERLERLRSRKAAVSQAIDQRRAATRFEPETGEGKPPPPLPELPGPPPPAPRAPAASGGVTAGAAEEESYTARLLKAKKRAWDETHNP